MSRRNRCDAPRLIVQCLPGILGLVRRLHLRGKTQLAFGPRSVRTRLTPGGRSFRTPSSARRQVSSESCSAIGLLPSRPCPLPRALRLSYTLGAFVFIRFFQKLSAMPYGHNPDDFPFCIVEKSVGRDNYFSKGQVGKFGQDSAGLWELLKSQQGFLRLVPECYGCRRVLSIDVRNGGKELAAG